jgi:hypothetical protein
MAVKKTITYTAVDLGLKSGTKWASTNIGANSEEEFGLYFQFGSTSGYSGPDVIDHDTWASYEPNNNEGEYNKDNIGKWDKTNVSSSCLNADVDAATVIMGEEWHLPTRAQIKELISGTVQEVTSINNIEGVKFINKSDTETYIFIPFSGYYIGNLFGNGYAGADIWGGSIQKQGSQYAYSLHVYGGDCSLSNSDRCYGYCMRGCQ